jgi:predicted RNase H-like HicB family nuclease
MDNFVYSHAGGRDVKSYIFPIVVEQDEDSWRAYVPELESRGAATWGKTREEAIRNMQEVAQLVIEELLEDGEPVPAGIRVSENPVVAVTV